MSCTCARRRHLVGVFRLSVNGFGVLKTFLIRKKKKKLNNNNKIGVRSAFYTHRCIRCRHERTFFSYSAFASRACTVYELIYFLFPYKRDFKSFSLTPPSSSFFLLSIDKYCCPYINTPPSTLITIQS